MSVDDLLDHRHTHSHGFATIGNMINVEQYYLNRYSLRQLFTQISKNARSCLSAYCAITCLMTSFPTSAATGQSELMDERSAWVEAMKSASRGPFSRIRWFCDDGSVHPPKPYACKDLGGGVQHGEWSADTKALREDGYYIANIYADLSDDIKNQIVAGDPLFAQMLIEQFLINADDGWILRKARYYRGAFQYEDEQAGSRKLLRTLSSTSEWLNYRYVVLRTAARYLDHGTGSASVQEIRQLSASLSEDNTAFKTIRAKIHGRPEASDAAEVRAFAKTLTTEEAVPYVKLARLIDQVYAKDLTKSLRQIQADKLPSNVQEMLEATATALAGDDSPLNQLQIVSETMAKIRDSLPAIKTGRQRLALLDFSLALESAFFTAATTIESRLGEFDRRGQLALLASTLDALYGSGLINARQHRAMADELTTIAEDEVTAANYKQSLDYLSLMPSWGTQSLRLFFGQAMSKLSRLEPKANLFHSRLLTRQPYVFSMRR